MVRAGAAAATEQLEARGQRFALGEGKYKAAIRLVRDYALLHRGEAQELLARAQMKAKVAGLRRLVERDSPVGAITVLDDEAESGTSKGESMARMSDREVDASASMTSLTLTDLGPSSEGRT